MQLIRGRVPCFDPFRAKHASPRRVGNEAWRPRNARESFWISIRHRRLPSVAVGGTPSCAQCGCHAQRVFESCVLRFLYVIRIAIDAWAGAMLCPDRAEHASPRRVGNEAWRPRNARESFWISIRHRRLPSVAVGGTPSCAQCGCHAQRVFESCVLRFLYVIRIAIDAWAGAMLCPDRAEHASPRRG